MNYKIKLNAARCLMCGEELESTHVHDFRMCVCENVAVDGGKEYIKRSVRDFNYYQDLTIYEELEEKKT